MKLGDLLNAKDSKYRVAVNVRPSETILVAVHQLAEHGRNSVTVIDDNGKLVGIVTESDVLRKCLVSGKALDKIKIEDVMTKGVAVGNIEDDLSYAINAMKEHRFRDIPIVDAQEKVIGIISMRDLLGVQLNESELRVRLLSDYISGYPG